MTDYLDLLDEGCTEEARPPSGNGLEEHLRWLKDRGAILRSGEPRARLRPLLRKRGALNRFLRERADA